ncbi:MAG: hypothetical protein OEY89_04255 [Gammaproteobacteria bacterium]|nr:hypothetical protein [Gammaproteobacteria bacterium]
MSVVLHINKLKLLMAGLLITLPLALQAGDNYPVVPKAKAKATTEFGCVNSVEYMRRNHMDELKHQRDETMHKGIRTTKYSLAECVECHVSEDANGKVARFGDDKHFCSSCHNYAAVSIDCFQCHNDKPQNGEAMSDQAMPVNHNAFALNKNAPLVTGTDLDISSSGSDK